MTHHPLAIGRRLRLAAAAAFAFTLVMVTPAAGAEWRQFRGPHGQGQGTATGLPTTWSSSQNLLWKTALPGPGGSSPVVFSNRILLTAYSGYAVPGSPGGDLGALQRHVLCFNAADGKLLWKVDVPALQPEQERVREHGYASSTPLVDEHRLYVFLGKSGVMAFTHEGRQLWQAKVGDKTHVWGSATSPLLYQNLVIINASVESDSLVALDRQTGQEIWRAGGIRESWNTPILVPVEGDRQELVVAIAGKVLGFDPATGQLLWSCATGIGWYMVPSLVHDQEVVYCIGGRTGGSLAVRAGGRGDVTSSRRLWTLNKGSNVSSPLFFQGHLYFFHENLGVAYCVEAASGRLVFEERIQGAGQVYASPILADGKIFAVDRTGRGFVIAAKPQFELLARNDLRDGGSFDASPALDGNRLLIRSDKYLYCLGSR
jgi:outer membrane protein assembly factor BamB